MVERGFDAETESITEGTDAASDRVVTIAGHKVVRRTGTLTESMRDAGPPSPDDVTILRDGRRLDTRERVLQFVREFEAEHPHLRRNSTEIDRDR